MSSKITSSLSLLFKYNLVNFSIFKKEKKDYAMVEGKYIFLRNKVSKRKRQNKLGRELQIFCAEEKMDRLKIARLSKDTYNNQVNYLIMRDDKIQRQEKKVYKHMKIMK